MIFELTFHRQRLDLFQSSYFDWVSKGGSLVFTANKRLHIFINIDLTDCACLPYVHSNIGNEHIHDASQGCNNAAEGEERSEGRIFRRVLRNGANKGSFSRPTIVSRLIGTILALNFNFPAVQSANTHINC
jgi:hypothetical protein